MKIPENRRDNYRGDKISRQVISRKPFVRYGNNKGGNIGNLYHGPKANTLKHIKSSYK